MLNGWIQVESANGRWTVLADWRARLFGQNGLRWHEWNATKNIEIIKSADHRTVYRVCLPDQSVFIKHYPTDHWRSRIRQWLRPTKAFTEWQRAVALTRLGINTVLPLAFGELDDHQSYLITQEWTNAQTLDQWLLGSPKRDEHAFRRSVAVNLAYFLARLHDAGIEHGDLHPGNFLCRAQQDGSPEIAIIDLYAVRIGKPLGRLASIANLAMLGHWFLQYTSLSERHSFWHAYVQARRQTIIPVDDRTILSKLEQQCWNGAVQIWQRRTFRCIKTNKDFFQLNKHGNKVWAIRSVPDSLLLPLLQDPNLPFNSPSSQMIKDSRSASVAIWQHTSNTLPSPLFCKRFMPTRWYDPLQHLIRPSPAMRSWINAFRLLNMGIPTPKPIALIHRRRWQLTRESYLLTAWLHDSETLYSYAQRLGPNPPIHEPLRHNSVFRQLARSIGKLHRLGLAHRDMKAANFLVQQNADTNNKPKLFFIDLVGMTRPRHLRQATMMQNLARLWVSFQSCPWLKRTDRLRFLLIYLETYRNRKKRSPWKTWWKGIAALSQQKILQNKCRQRPLS